MPVTNTMETVSKNLKDFNPEKESIGYCNSPVGESTLGNKMKTMSVTTAINSHLTKHCAIATAVTVLYDCNVEARHIKSLTGHKSDSVPESYNAIAFFSRRKTFQTY